MHTYLHANMRTYYMHACRHTHKHAHTHTHTHKHTHTQTRFLSLSLLLCVCTHIHVHVVYVSTAQILSALSSTTRIYVSIIARASPLPESVVFDSRVKLLKHSKQWGKSGCDPRRSTATVGCRYTFTKTEREKEREGHGQEGEREREIDRDRAKEGGRAGESVLDGTKLPSRLNERQGQQNARGAPPKAWLLL
jgi:hypothetical protein